MDVLQVSLIVENIPESINPALFCSKLGGPITFHLRVGKGEEKLIKSVKRTTNNYGGRYVKHYRDMTPHTVLLVTDLGFRSGPFNRPAICVTYIGDSVHTNSLRNINEYIHPWENLERWKKIDLFEVVYHQNRMFQCSADYGLEKKYVPVSRTIKASKFVSKVSGNESPELMEVSSEDDDLFGPREQPLITKTGSNAISSEDDGLFIRSDEEKAISEATTNVRSSPYHHVQMEYSIFSEEHPSSVPVAEKGMSKTLVQDGTTTSKSYIVPVDFESTSMANQQNVLHRSQCTIQREMSSPSHCTNPPEKMNPSQGHKKSNQKRRETWKQCKDSNKDKVKDCFVLLERIEMDIEDESSKLLRTSKENNLEGKISNIENRVFHSDTRKSDEEIRGRDFTLKQSNNRNANVSGLTRRNDPITTKVKSKNVGLNEKPIQTQSEQMKERDCKGGKNAKAKNKPNALLEGYKVDIGASTGFGASTGSIVSCQGNSKGDICVQSEQMKGRDCKGVKNAKAKNKPHAILEGSKVDIGASAGSVTSRQGNSKGEIVAQSEQIKARDCKGGKNSKAKNKPNAILEGSKVDIGASAGSVVSCPGNSKREICARSEKIKERDCKGVKSAKAKNKPNAILEASKVDIGASAGSIVSCQGKSKGETGNLCPSTSKNKTVDNADGKIKPLEPQTLSTQNVPGCSNQALHISKPFNNSTRGIAGKSFSRKYMPLKITIENSGESSSNHARTIELLQKDSTENQEELSDSESSSNSDVQNVPLGVSTYEINSSSSRSSSEDRDRNRTQGPSTSSAARLLLEPKSEDSDSKDDLTLFKKRGRGFQDRYRRHEKVSMLKWLVDHNKFRNLRGILVWREMERKQVIPGRSNQSLKNQFLRHLLPTLDHYPFLTDGQKSKFRGEVNESSDEDSIFFYHGSQNRTKTKNQNAR